jgi:ABC-2 type transport system permease protein
MKGQTPMPWPELRATYAFVARNFTLVRRYLGWEIVFLVYSAVNAITIGFIGLDSPEPGRKVLYLVIGAMLWGFLSILFHEVAESVSWERWEGTIEYTFMAPIRRITHLGGMCIYAIIYGLVRTVIILLAVSLFFDLNIPGGNLGAAAVVLLASSFSFIGLGLMAAVLPLLSPERGSQATHIMEGVILLISGVYYEVSVLPSWIRPLSVFSPATYTLQACRAALLDGQPLVSLLPTMAILLATGIALIPLGLFVFSLGEAHAMRTGKLKRSG